MIFGYRIKGLNGSLSFICTFLGGSEFAMLSHARDKHGMTIKARPPQQQQGSQVQTRRLPPPISKATPDLIQVQAQRSQSQVPRDRQQQSQAQVPSVSGEMSCFLCPGNGNKKSYPDSRLKAHLFAMHGCKVSQSAIRCNMCSFSAESVRQLGLHVQITHSRKVTTQGQQGQSQGHHGNNPQKKPLNPEFIRRLSDAGIAVSKRGVEVTVVDNNGKGPAGPSVAKYARRSEPAVTVDKKGLDLFIVGEVNRNNGGKVMEHSPLMRVGSAQPLARASSMAQSRTNTQGSHGHQPPVATTTSMPKSDLHNATRSPETATAMSAIAMSKEQARQRAIQDLRARLTSKLKLNAQLQKMASTPNIESTKAKVHKELQLMKSQLQAMVKNVDPPRRDSGNPAAANGLGSLKQPQNSLKQLQRPAPAIHSSPAPAGMKCAHCPFSTTYKSALTAHEKSCATKEYRARCNGNNRSEIRLTLQLNRLLKFHSYFGEIQIYSRINPLEQVPEGRHQEILLQASGVAGSPERRGRGRAAGPRQRPHISDQRAVPGTRAVNGFGN